MTKLLSCLFLLTAAPGILAASIVITRPDSNYTTATTLIPITGVSQTLLNSISDGRLTIGFSSAMRIDTVPDSWGTWGAPPNTESATPTVLNSFEDDDLNPITSVTFSFSSPLAIFGFEAEPDLFGLHTLTATFFRLGSPYGTIQQDIEGNGGARLFALQAGAGESFDSVTISSVDSAFAVAQLRYAPVPEPAFTGLIGAALAGAAILRRRKTIKN